MGKKKGLSSAKQSGFNLCIMSPWSPMKLGDANKPITTNKASVAELLHKEAFEVEERGWFSPTPLALCFAQQREQGFLNRVPF